MKREASSDPETRPVAKQARVSPDALNNNQASNLLIKPSMEPLFRRLCNQFGWSPTELTCTKISDLLRIDTSRTTNVEPALFAFVQHLPFVWNDGALFIGSKRINSMVRSVWYKPLTPGDSVGESLYLNQRDSFNGSSIHKSIPKVDESLVDYFWPSFTTAFDLTSQKGDYKYITGVHTILLEFPKLRKICSDYELRAWAEGRLSSATNHTPLRKYEMPFLPDSVWMSKPIVRPAPRGPPRLSGSGGFSSRSSRQPSSATIPRSSIENIERVQSLIQDQRGRLVAVDAQRERRPSRSRRPTIQSFVERSSECTEATEPVSELVAETSNNATSQMDREATPMRPLDPSAVDHGSPMLQHNDVKVAFSTSDRITEAQVQLTVTLPTRFLQQHSVLHFSPVTSVDLPPIVPPRRLVLQALCALAMNTVDDSDQ